MFKTFVCIFVFNKGKTLDIIGSMDLIFNFIIDVCGDDVVFYKTSTNGKINGDTADVDERSI